MDTDLDSAVIQRMKDEARKSMAEALDELGRDFPKATRQARVCKSTISP